ncbi:sigma-70 family RNA polymerase sigma factor [Hyphomicrobium sp. NDB2Meth4]|uniref:RNA polymerase sigma factor n=1 Tax=Hyphomicrobium sp. NDB2Meth4 TaxID=1892846 RepID=UPI00093068D7|nr:sigma-70 family RNA polymerase sigma factor [Hyphomicrobium sp. NDB2Meth4]
MNSQPTATDFDSLFRVYHRELGSFAYGRLRDREAASDVVQDAFVRYIAHTRQAAAVPEAPRFFLWRIASNLILDFGRRERRRGHQAAIDDAAVAEIADPAPSPEHQLAARQEYRILVRALGELSANQRAALVMNRVDQMTHAEIARRLGVSPSMVNKYIMRALTHCVMRLMEAGR